MRLPSCGEHLGGDVVLAPPVLLRLDVEPLGRRRDAPAEPELVDRDAEVHLVAERLGERLAEVRVAEALVGLPQAIELGALGRRVGAGVALDVLRFELELRLVLVHRDHADEQLRAQNAVGRRDLGEAPDWLLAPRLRHDREGVLARVEVADDGLRRLDDQVVLQLVHGDRRLRVHGAGAADRGEREQEREQGTLAHGNLL